MTEAVNLGIPAVRRVPALRRHLAPLVREIAGIRTEPRAPGLEGCSADEDIRHAQRHAVASAAPAPDARAAAAARQRRSSRRARGSGGAADSCRAPRAARARAEGDRSGGRRRACAPRSCSRQLEQIIHEIANAERLELSGPEQARLAEELANDMIGYGPLQSLLLDDGISDIMVNGPTSVYVERHGKIELHRRRVPRQRSHRHGGAEDRGAGRPPRSTRPARWWTRGCRTAAAST